MTKKWTTIGYLPLRSTIFPLTGLLLLLGLGEGAVLLWQWRNPPSLPLEGLFDRPATLLFLGALVLTGVLLAVRCAGGDATLERLDLSPTGRFLLWGGWGALCFFLLMAWQVLVFLLLGTLYFSLEPTMAHPQAMMLAAYRSELIYALLPLWEPLRYLCNLAMCVDLGFAAALWVLLRGRKRWHIAPFLSLGVALYTFAAGPGPGFLLPYVCGLIHLALGGWCLGIWREVSHEKA